MDNQNLKYHATYAVCKSFENFINELEEDEMLSELETYIPKPDDMDKYYKWNIEKTKLVLKVLKSKSKDDIEKILSYLNQSEYGWHGNQYNLYNSCLYYGHHCKELHPIGSTKEETISAIASINEIFLHKEYGSITTYLFGYCLTALFSSQLNHENTQIPYFLQIACERNSSMYRLINEIVSICDINTGLNQSCQKYIQHGYCDFDYVTIFPSQSKESSLNDMLYNRDIPVIIEEFENEKFYGLLLRETANIPGKLRRLGMKDKLNILPIFICPTIRSQFKNFFSMDLTALDIDEEYIELIQKNKQRLASWAFELVMNSSQYFHQRQLSVFKKHHKTIDERPLFNNISYHINLLRKNYGHYTKLNVKDINNIGILTCFLSHYMEIFKQSIRLPENENLTDNNSNSQPAELITYIVLKLTERLFKLHNTYSPALPMSLTINTLSADSKESKRVQKKGRKYASEIIKYYQSYGVSIEILPNAEYKDDRYIFPVKLLPGTNGNMISLHADDIRRLLGFEFLNTVITPSSIQIIASEKPLRENSLQKILNSTEFKNSKMEIPYAIGYDLTGQIIIADIAKFPHMLIGGASGSGKSSALHSLLMSIICKQNANKIKLLLFDFGASRLKMFNNSPHMLMPVITVNETEKGKQCIMKLKEVMESRLKKLDAADEKKVDKIIKRWPSIICVIDEFPTFIRRLVSENKNSHMLITDILERARKVKIHLILATQDATKSNIAIKTTNLGAAIAFKCNTRYDSQAIIGTSDAINLSGKGSMYFKCDQHEGIKRLQGAFMPPEEIMDMLDNMNFDISNTNDQIDNINWDLISPPNIHNTEPISNYLSSENNHDEILTKIILWTLSQDKISNKQIKDNYEMGYDKANAILSELETYGLISKKKTGTKLPRTVIPQKIDDMPIDVIKLLNTNGHSDDEIANILNNRHPIITDASPKSDPF